MERAPLRPPSDAVARDRLHGPTIGAAIAFSLLEHTSIAFGFAWALDKITTVGALPTPSDTGGRVVLAILELFGIGTLFYGLATVAEFFVSGQLSGLLDQRRIQKMIDSYTDHFIVCGYGRVGRQVARDLRASDAQVVVIDPNPDNRETARHDGSPTSRRRPHTTRS